VSYRGGAAPSERARPDSMRTYSIPGRAPVREEAPQNRGTGFVDEGPAPRQLERCRMGPVLRYIEAEPLAEAERG
jgi:hypothetical protein